MTEFLIGIVVGAFGIVVIPLSVFWLHCRIMFGGYNRIPYKDNPIE